MSPSSNLIEYSATKALSFALLLDLIVRLSLPSKTLIIVLGV
jgi:hypothetical protein